MLVLQGGGGGGDVTVGEGAHAAAEGGDVGYGVGAREGEVRDHVAVVEVEFRVGAARRGEGGEGWVEGVGGVEVHS